MPTLGERFGKGVLLREPTQADYKASSHRELREWEARNLARGRPVAVAPTTENGQPKASAPEASQSAKPEARPSDTQSRWLAQTHRFTEDELDFLDETGFS